MKMAQLFRAVALVAAAGVAGLAGAQTGHPTANPVGGIVRAAADAISKAKAGSSATAPAAGEIETGFSPDGGAEALVLKVIGSARQSIRLAAYSITAPAVVRALVDAKRRGVEVAIVADYKQNISEDKSGKAKAALNTLATEGIPISMVSTYFEHHDKYIVADAVHVETGSYNYSAVAATRNSENVLVVWNNAQVAANYLRHWQSRYEQGTAYRATL